MQTKTKTNLILGTVGMILGFSALAHDEALESGWCRGGSITVLGEFMLKEPLLQQFKGDSGLVCSQLKSCGHFDDDDYTIARRTAEGLCQVFSEKELAYRQQSSDAGTVRPIFHSPAVFKNSESDHHALYQLTLGIRFSCGYCRMPEVIEPIQRR
ncbi:hypothetical protein WG68_08905 [Arsukibacterium ikkense]|uniref:Uncharacterized protein n=1 Tax=Arsukibacterium ikkense TaxID=336831 RepID=A0A0M2V9H1_9GAMM|nr:hypothetical protein [Arsukibacterium ikkense]KKO45818.1 hypothetical protein WG68_08905 [Arsukibacterium ikkense]